MVRMDVWLEERREREAGKTRLLDFRIPLPQPLPLHRGPPTISLSHFSLHLTCLNVPRSIIYTSHHSAPGPSDWTSHPLQAAFCDRMSTLCSLFNAACPPLKATIDGKAKTATLAPRDPTQTRAFALSHPLSALFGLPSLPTHFSSSVSGLYDLDAAVRKVSIQSPLLSDFTASADGRLFRWLSVQELSLQENTGCYTANPTPLSSVSAVLNSASVLNEIPISIVPFLAPSAPLNVQSFRLLLCLRLTTQ